MDTLVAMDLSFSQVRALFVLAPARRADRDQTRSRSACGCRWRPRVANIDQLVCQELVLRREDPGDRRIKRVSLTESGEAWSPVTSRTSVTSSERSRAGWISRTQAVARGPSTILAGDALRARSQEFCT